MRYFTAILTFILLTSFGASHAAPLIYEKQYTGFTLWLDCRQHGAIAFRYDIGQDTGNIGRERGSFKTDTDVPAECQPNSGKSYRTATVNPESGTWDRGHLVPANHMDDNEKALKETFLVTNILPQNSTFNQSSGAWSFTEVIAECYRDISKLTVWGGVIWGDDASNDFFVETHGVKTPDYWWKVIYRHDKSEYVAWLFPNHRSAIAVDIDEYLVSIVDLKDSLEFVTDFGVIEDGESAGITPAKSWEVKKVGSDLECEGMRTSGG